MNEAALEVRVPGWLRDHAGETHLASDDAVVQMLNRLAAENVRQGTGGPFAAAVVDDASREIVSVGVNLVLSSQISSAHAEVVALSLAQSRLRTWSLRADGRGRTLFVNAQPCAMCLGAVVWSGVSGLDFSALGSDVERLTGFDEGPVTPDWRQQLVTRGISVSSGRCESESHAVLADYGKRVRDGEIPLYNR